MARNPLSSRLQLILRRLACRPVSDGILTQRVHQGNLTSTSYLIKWRNAATFTRHGPVWKKVPTGSCTGRTSGVILPNNQVGTLFYSCIFLLHSFKESSVGVFDLVATKLSIVVPHIMKSLHRRFPKTVRQIGLLAIIDMTITPESNHLTF